MYPWKRFWCPRDGAFSLGDRGYLYDPDSELGRAANPDVVTFEDIADTPCLILLGEPGIGKSTAIRAAEARLHEAIPASGDAIIQLDLKDYGSDLRLIQESFQSETFRTWLAGSHTLHLLFDSFDEGQLEIRNIANVTSGELKKCRGLTSRLRLRIACRTAEWPVSREQLLVQLWGEENLKVLELLPLRRVDVAVAVETEGLDVDSVFAAVADKEAEPWAHNPKTLELLIQAYRNDGTLPSTKGELYEQGCLALCEETSASRRASGHFGNLSPEQRLEVASRIACVTVLSGKPTVFTGPSTTAPATEATVLNDFTGGDEVSQGNRFDVQEAQVRETLRTGLFSGRGPERLGFSHATYADYLAARYLSQRDLDLTQMLSLVCHSMSSEGRVVPQLRHTAAWLASANREVFDRLVGCDPQVLLRSDMAHADPSTKAELVAALLDGFDKEELDDSDWELRWDYRRLAHSELAQQLEPFIEDRQRNTTVRRFAIGVAEACCEKGLLDLLVRIALDESETIDTRNDTAHAVVGIGDQGAIATLKPLAFGESGPDPQDELRGAAMKGLWPSDITAEELFENLHQPQQESFGGTYQHFVSYDLTPHLTADHLVPALRWCAKQPRRHSGLSNFDEVMDCIARLAWEHLERSDVREELAAYIVTRIEHHDGCGVDTESLASADPALRRDLIEEVVTRVEDFDHHAFSLIHGSSALVLYGDMDWLIERASSSTTLATATRWAKLARRLYSGESVEHYDTIVTSYQLHDALRNEFEPLPAAVFGRGDRDPYQRSEA